VSDQVVRVVVRMGRGKCPHCGSWNENPLEIVTPETGPSRCRNCRRPLVIEPPEETT
jgi:hypothetical protein